MTARLSDLRRVDLDELNAQAELQTRVDRKYILPSGALPPVLDELPAGTAVLEIADRRALRYESRYFDTPALDSFHGAAHGRRRRFKVRARTYVDSGGSFLEVKTRGGRSATVKERVPVLRDELDEDGIAYATELLTDAGIPRAPWLARHLDPVLVTRYRRVTLLLPAAGTTSDASRGTIDLELEWIDVDGRLLSLPGSVIVETKSGQRAGALDRALWRQGHRPSTLSKYGTGLAALRPHLPSNRWRRVLDRHFAGAEASVPPTPTRSAA
ncbi:polyphosphate polymerase domain-containing protein [Microbacterium sp. RU33B]|uniref:polyphosphate polymerase domain-containing protein n=1 Tax=Microbacterium sp. RU33B TaxID=1907390 RepID=UPI0009603DBF|nr:polyphosphate polymerase domain-containing protein [Microbacterium sp. RU33B]SIT67063.1 VTC domain-containing protein [Microbacterium sp. RU33B]